MHKSSFVYAFLLQLITYPASAQVTFNRISNPEGSFGMVNGVTQDQQGYMWFSSYGSGLYRYDGYHVTRFIHDPRESGSLASDNVSCVFADRKGFIWIGTTNSGLDRFDPGTGIFTHFRHNASELTSLSDGSVTAILEDREGLIWVGTEDGLNRLDARNNTFTHYRREQDNTRSLSCNRVQVLYEDHRGTLWIGTCGSDRSMGSDERGGLNRFDRRTEKFLRYLHNPKDSLTLIDDRIGAIFEDSRGTFWVSTVGDGLHTMDRENGTFERHTYDPAHPEKLSGPPPEKDVGTDLNNFFVIEDNSGVLWFASSKRWITSYDPTTKRIHHFNSFNGDVQAVQSVTEAFSSREGVLWLTTWAGSIFRIDPLQSIIPHEFTGCIIQSIHEDTSGTLWLGTFGEGFIQIDRRKGIMKRFFTASNRYGLSDSWVPAIFAEDDSTLWIGSANGLSHFNKGTKIFTRYFNNPQDETSPTKGDVVAIIEDTPGFLWLATVGGLDHFDIKTRHFTHYRNIPNDTTSLSDNGVSALLKDHSGNLWVGTRHGILNLFNSPSKKFKRFPCSGHIGTIVEDAEGIIWVGTLKGLYRSNPAVDSFYRFTRDEIGLTATTIITGIFEDDKKNLWVGSSAGILRFSPNRNWISIYNKNQNVDAAGLTSPWMHGVKGPHGEFFFGDRTGYYHFFPDQIKTNPTPPQICIRDFRLADQIVKPGRDGPLKVPLSQTNEIRLKYDQNVFSFDFAGIHYASPEDNQHLFMLENLDNTWRKAGSEKRALYYSVPPGKYIFRVKASNSDGLWAEKHITVIISPPWWRTWWAYTCYALLFVAISAGYIKWREGSLRKEKRLLEEKVRVRTLELQAEKEVVEFTLTELKATQEQLIAAEKSASVEKSKQAVLNERLRISQELHDEVGATLSSISIFSQAAIQKNEKGNIADSKNILEKIGESSREVMGELSDTVWLINPLNDNLRKIIQRISNYALPLCNAKDMRFEIQNTLTDNPALGIEKRKGVYLIMKEAINNSLKYASAKNLVIEFEKNCDFLHIAIRDDGKGFDENHSFAGNGLNNMRQRAIDMEGKINIHSAPQKGTQIILSVPLTNIGDT